MKKPILMLVAFVFIAITALAKTSISKPEVYQKVKNEFMQLKHRACIKACNACISSCNKVVSRCTKENDSKMDDCLQLCKECSTTCIAASELMSLKSDGVEEMCALCAAICEKCAKECKKFKMDDCKECAKDCKKAAKLCRKM